MSTHLEARRASMTFRRRLEEAVVSPVNDEINELRARLEKLVTKNTEVPQSTSTSPFNVEIQKAPLPVSFRMPTNPSMTRWIFYRSQCSLVACISQLCYRGQPRSGFAKSNWRLSPLRDNYRLCLCVSSKEPANMQLL